MLVVNLFGAPGSGKSTTAAAVFSILKSNNINCELVTEYAKDIVWSKNEELLNYQYKIFAEQLYRIHRLANQVEIVVTDSPLLLQLVYLKRTRSGISNRLFDDYLKELIVEASFSFRSMEFFIHRDKPYNPKGRMQTETQSDFLSEEIQQTVKKYFRLIEIKSSNAVRSIIANLNTIRDTKITIPQY